MSQISIPNVKSTFSLNEGNCCNGNSTASIDLHSLDKTLRSIKMPRPLREQEMSVFKEGQEIAFNPKFFLPIVGVSFLVPAIFTPVLYQCILSNASPGLSGLICLSSALQVCIAIGSAYCLLSKNREKRRTLTPLLPVRRIERDSQVHEMKCYFRKKEKHFVNLVKVASSEMPPLKKDCLVSIVVAVAAHQERNLKECLLTLAKQSIGHDKYEIVCYLNSPPRVSQDQLRTLEYCKSVATEVQQRYPELRIAIIQRSLTPPATIGSIREFPNDIVAYRALCQRRPDLLMLRLDADTLAAPPTLLANHIRQYLKYEKAIGVTGAIDFDYPSYVLDARALISWRLNQYLGRSLCVGNNERKFGHQASGINFSCRAFHYCVAGGYRTDVTGGEDTWLGHDIANTSQGYFVRINQKVWTSGRRAIAAEKEGINSFDQWGADQTAFKLEDDSIRSFNPKEVDLKKFSAFVENSDLENYCLGAILKLSPQLHMADKNHPMVRAAYRCGIDLVIADNKVSVGSIDRLRRNLRRFAVSADKKWKMIAPHSSVSIQ